MWQRLIEIITIPFLNVATIAHLESFELFSLTSGVRVSWHACSIQQLLHDLHSQPRVCITIESLWYHRLDKLGCVTE